MTKKIKDSLEGRQPYPYGIDCVWLASDRNGHLGVFITAGDGPIPAQALDSAYMPVEDIEEQLCQLPIVSKAQLLVSVKQPDSLVDLAERGLFVYCWTESLPTMRKERRVYEPMAILSKPITASSLPSDLAALARAVRLTDVVFAAAEAIDICAHVSCVEAGQ